MKAVYLKVRLMAIAWLSACLVACTSNVEADLEVIEYPIVLKTVDIRSPKTVISVHFSSSKPMAMQIY